MQIGIEKQKGQLIQKREAHNKQDDILFLNQDKVPQKSRKTLQHPLLSMFYILPQNMKKENKVHLTSLSKNVLLDFKVSNDVIRME